MYWFILNSYFRENCSVYEIYPQRKTPHLTQIAHLDFYPSNGPPPRHLLPGKVIWFVLYGDRIFFRVWDYRLNCSISFSVDVDYNKFKCNIEVYVILQSDEISL